MNLPHMSLKDGEETPAEAFIRKMPKEETVIDESQVRNIMSDEGRTTFHIP